MKTYMHVARLDAFWFHAGGTGAMSEEELFSQIIESFPNMIFLKYGEPAIRDDYDRGFRYAYFSYIMDIASGFKRLDMIGRNAKDHFPIHFERYFDDDRAVMRLKPRDSSKVLDIIEPWKVASGDHVLHTRKVNLEEKYMLGTFIKADEVHLGKVKERRGSIPPPLSPPPPKPQSSDKESNDQLWTSVWQWLPVPVLVTYSTPGAADKPRPPLKNTAYRITFATSEAEEALGLASMDALAKEGEMYERSQVEVDGKCYHVLQRPLRLQDGELVLVYVAWPMAQADAVESVRAALQ